MTDGFQPSLIGVNLSAISILSPLPDPFPQEERGPFTFTEITLKFLKITPEFNNSLRFNWDN
jgi:hypothetical protein